MHSNSWLIEPPGTDTVQALYQKKAPRSFGAFGPALTLPIIKPGTQRRGSTPGIPRLPGRPRSLMNFKNRAGFRYRTTHVTG